MQSERWAALAALGLLSDVAVAATPSVEYTGPVELFAPGIASTQYSEVRLTLSPDGATALWFTRNRPGGPGGYDIWMSKRTGSTWSEARPVSFDSPQRDFDPAFTADGRYVYFCSDRPGGFGGDDIYRVAVTPEGFGVPELLDEAVNSRGNEWAPMLSRENVLLFSSNGRGGAGGFDLFIASAAHAGSFSTARAVPGSINSAADEFDATFIAGDEVILFSRAPHVETDTVQLYSAVRQRGSFDVGRSLPDMFNLTDQSSYGPMIDWSHPNRFTFTRAGELYLAGFTEEDLRGQIFFLPDSSSDLQPTLGRPRGRCRMRSPVLCSIP